MIPRHAAALARRRGLAHLALENPGLEPGRGRYGRPAGDLPWLVKMEKWGFMVSNGWLNDGSMVVNMKVKDG